MHGLDNPVFFNTIHISRLHWVYCQHIITG